MDVHAYLIDLGQQAAELLGYTRLGSTLEYGFTAWEPRWQKKRRNDQVTERIQAGKITIMLQQPDYRITWYLITGHHGETPEVLCGISGVVTDGILAQVMTLWDNADIRQAYDQKAAWYDANPMYRQPVKAPTVTKTHLSPRQEAPEKRR